MPKKTKVQQSLTGRKVKHLDHVTDYVDGLLGWSTMKRLNEHRVLVLDDDSWVFASRDEEGNGAGELVRVGTNVGVVEGWDVLDFQEHLKGQKNRHTMPVTDDIYEMFGWPKPRRADGKPDMIVLADFSAIVPARDPELNGPGWLVRLTRKDRDDLQAAARRR